jgi:SynChlorMet cassette protein ScmD
MVNKMNLAGNPIGNPLLVFREEFDDCAILFDPETGHAVGLNPVAAFIWKKCDGNHSRDDILLALEHEFESVPGEAERDLDEFIGKLAARGFIGYEVKQSP